MTPLIIRCFAEQIPKHSSLELPSADGHKVTSDTTVATNGEPRTTRETRVRDETTDDD